MKKQNKINFLFRKHLPQYNSIEELFVSIIDEISRFNSTSVSSLIKSGGSPLVVIQNLISFRKEKGTVYHITGDIHYMALVAGKQCVLTIHDVGSAIKGNVVKRLYIKLFWFWLPALFVKRITVISEFTKNELSKIIPFAKHKIFVIYNPVSPSFRYSPKEFNEIKPVILLMGTKENKNLERVFRAIEDISCQLLIVGKLTEKQNILLEELGLDYINKTNIKFAEVVQCYEGCDLLCFPSTYEGFGMPVIEAQAAGRPVLTSNLCSLPEVAGEAALMVDPYSIQDIKNGVLKIINDPNLRNELIIKGLENAKRFKVEKIANVYLTLYKEIE